MPATQEVDVVSGQNSKMQNKDAVPIKRKTCIERRWRTEYRLLTILSSYLSA